MSQERETRELTLESGLVVVLKTYMTGGESIEVEAAELGEGLEVSRGGTATLNPGAVHVNSLRKLVDVIVVKVGEVAGAKEKWDALTNLKLPEFRKVMAAIKAVANGSGLSAEEKKE